MASEREFAVECVRRLQQAGHEALFAGGCVRDELLGLTPVDYDVATSATPEQVQSLFRKTHQFGASFGVVEVLGPRQGTGGPAKIQVATFRHDGHYSDGRRPDAVTFSTAEEDARRRDFTVNGLFCDPLTGTVTDYVGGQADLAAGVLRAIGDPHARFAEDKLRVLRAARMAARFDFVIDPATRDAARAVAPEVGVVSGERVAEELRKVLAHPSRVLGVSLLHDLGLTDSLLPEFADTTGERQRVLAHLTDSGDWASACACLLAAGVNAKPLGERLKLSLVERARIERFQKGRAAVIDADRPPRSQLFPLLAEPGVRELLAVARAEALATGQPLEGVRQVEAWLGAGVVFDPPAWVTGDDLKALGFRPGPRFKPALLRARSAQLDGDAATPAEALALARALLEARP